MLIVCYSAKGGQGCSTVAAMLAIHADGAVLVDGAGGDIPAILGIAEPDGPGITDALVTGTALADTPQTWINSRLSLVVYGNRNLVDIADPRWSALSEALAQDCQRWVLDAGTGPAHATARHADHALLVTRYCYLAMRRAARLSIRPSGIVGIREHGRSLGDRDLERIVGAPVVASLPVADTIARCVDAGLLASAGLPEVARSALSNVDLGVGGGSA